MTIFEPLFLLLVLAAAIYMLVVLTVSVATPRRHYRLGDTQCFDDWCIAVTSATRATPTTVTVGLRLSSRAKRVSHQLPRRAQSRSMRSFSLGRRYKLSGRSWCRPMRED